MPPRSGYRSRQVVLRDLKATLAQKSHAVHWGKTSKSRGILDYRAVCTCGWEIEGRYSVIKDATEQHLSQAMPLKAEHA